MLPTPHRLTHIQTIFPKKAALHSKLQESVSQYSNKDKISITQRSIKVIM